MNDECTLLQTGQVVATSDCPSTPVGDPVLDTWLFTAGGDPVLVLPAVELCPLLATAAVRRLVVALVTAMEFISECRLVPDATKLLEYKDMLNFNGV